MFYKLIQNKRDLWLAADNCPIRELLSYVISKAKLRDAQIEAVKTYLFLKIACQCRSLYDLFTDGEFNSNINWDELELTATARECLPVFSERSLLSLSLVLRRLSVRILISVA